MTSSMVLVDHDKHKPIYGWFTEDSTVEKVVYSDIVGNTYSVNTQRIYSTFMRFPYSDRYVILSDRGLTLELHDDVCATLDESFSIELNKHINQRDKVLQTCADEIFKI